jgi:hypothetical protein
MNAPLLRWLPVALLLAACGSDGGDDDAADAAPQAEAVFPADYASTYTEVRNCRQSGDHDLNHIRVLADPRALGPYTHHDAPIPVGAVLLKEEYEFGDDTCAGPIKQWTVMKHLAAGTAPDQLDWKWQRVDADRKVVGEDTPRCSGCHSGCTEANGGYEWTCTQP